LDDKGKIPSDVQDLHFTLSLVEDLPNPQNASDFSHLLNLQKDIHYTFDTNGCCRLSLSFCELSAAHDCRKFVLLAQHGSLIGVSTPMMSVRYRLESQTSMSPIIWFKDRGGKKNCIEVPVRLVSSQGTNVTGVYCPIKVELIYSDGESVPDQSLLDLRESRLLIQNGICSMRIKIKEVSMRHKGKLFALKISPDILKAPNTKEISCTVSSFIEVRSKIAGLPTASITSIPTFQQFHPLPPIPSLPPIPLAPVSKKRKVDQSECELSETPYYSDSSVPAIGSFHPTPAPLPSTKKLRFDEPQADSFDLDQSSVDDLPNFPPSTTPSIQSWLVSLAHRLEQLKWKVIGLEVNRSDPSQTPRQVYEMSNPNDELDELISQCYALTHPTFPRDLESQSPASTLETSEDEDNEDIFQDLVQPFFDADFPENSLSFDSVNFSN